MASIYCKPCEKLSKFVSTYFLMDKEDLPATGFEFTIYPNGNTILGIAYGKTFPAMTDCGNTFTVRNSAIMGRYLHPVSVRFFDTQMLLTVFKPFGCYYIFGIPEGIFQNKTIGLRSLGITGYEKTVEEISKVNSVRDKIYFLETWLINTLAKNDITPVGYTEYALTRITTGAGRVPLKKMLFDLHLNQRYLERHFNQYLGMSAKEFSKVIRFSSMANYLINNPKANGYELCEIGNFYDSSHLIKEFGKYAGATPIHFLEKILNSGGVQIEAIMKLNLADTLVW